MTVLIDGEPNPGLLSVFDGAVLRGDGCFEAIRSYGGRPFTFDRHYRRLTRSSSALRLSVPAEADLEAWVQQIAEEAGDSIIRVVLTRGGVVPTRESAGHCLVMAHPLPLNPERLTLLPVSAPWHPGGVDWDLAGVKTISYAPNQAATRAAREAGFEDALLISREGLILEGPTFSVAWAVDGNIETPEAALGILESVTVGLAAELCDDIGLKLVEDRYQLERIEQATEVMAMSTVKEICPVRAVGKCEYRPGPITESLRAAYQSLVSSR
jgi:branched-subunit amino acid aminotransferase/4-amino-4-deoxychorismate lyase